MASQIFCESCRPGRPCSPQHACMMQLLLDLDRREHTPACLDFVIPKVRFKPPAKIDFRPTAPLAVNLAALERILTHRLQIERVEEEKRQAWLASKRGKR